MDPKEQFISKTRGTLLRVLAVLLSAISVILGAALGQLTTVLGLIAVAFVFLVWLYSRYHIRQISMTYIQILPELESPAKVHQLNEFYIERDHAVAFDAYIEIPVWMDEFDIKFEPDPPLSVGTWQVPEEFTDKDDDNYIRCRENAHSFGFELSIGGSDSDELGTANRELRIIEENYNKEIAKLALTTESPDRGSQDDYRAHHTD